MEHHQFAIEEESKSKAEAIRSKKKLEQDINELDSSLQRSTLENADIQKNVKKYQESMRSKIDDLENAKRETDSYREYMISFERKANSLKNSVEETPTMQEGKLNRNYLIVMKKALKKCILGKHQEESGGRYS